MPFDNDFGIASQKLPSTPADRRIAVAGDIRGSFGRYRPALYIPNLPSAVQSNTSSNELGTSPVLRDVSWRHDKPDRIGRLERRNASRVVGDSLFGRRTITRGIYRLSRGCNVRWSLRALEPRSDLNNARWSLRAQVRDGLFPVGGRMQRSGVVL
jgi:hypothetical protein